MATRKTPEQVDESKDLRQPIVDEVHEPTVAQDRFQSVIEKEMPGWRVVPPTFATASAIPSERKAQVDAVAPPADAVMPRIDELQQRYEAQSSVADATAPQDSEQRGPLDIVEVESGGQRKKVAIQGGRVKWSQG